MSRHSQTWPSSTYRLQLHPGFTFDDARAVVPYLADLGVGHLYLSPILQAVAGSQHGYDVVDHSRVNDELGGEQGFRDLVAAAHEHDLGVVVDLVPNHMAFVAPETANRQLWQVLKDGRDADAASWFDIDWRAGGGRIGLPILGSDLQETLTGGDITLDRSGDEPVLRYYEHIFPVTLGSADDTDDIATILDRQHYRLASWRDKDRVLNYRRFFDVDGLIGVRVEDDEVFDASHAVLLRLHHEGLIDGFRIDHPDGLADPTGYLQRLARRARPDTPIWVEKILEGDERLPKDWPVAGTTGYDALRVVQAALTDPVAAPELDAAWAATGAEADFETVVSKAKTQVVTGTLVPEVLRLTRRARDARPDLDPDRLRDALEQLLVAGEVYRAYVRVGAEPQHHDVERLDEAAAHARAARPDLTREVDALLDLLLLRGPADLASRDGHADHAHDANSGLADRAGDDLAVRFEQTWGPVMAKGIEDTSFYRWHRLDALNEVGSDPTVVADADPQLMHRWAAHQVAHHPRTMTTASTHDTKRSEDVRARLLALAGDPAGWQRVSAVTAEQARAAGVDLPTAHLVWQTLAGVGEIDDERLEGYLTKAIREAKEHTAWVDGDADYEQRVLDFGRAANRSGPIREAIDAVVADNAEAIRASVLGAKLLQLTLPGVPDVYQGSETVTLSLVDPDNRRSVDYAALRAGLDRSRADSEIVRDSPDQEQLDQEKLGLTSAVLHLRQNRPAAFGRGSGYEPWQTDNDHLVGFFRGRAPGTVGSALGRKVSRDVAVLATRAPARLAAAGGWKDELVTLPSGTWRDVLTGETLDSEGEVRVADLLAERPIAVLEAQEDA